MTAEEQSAFLTPTTAREKGLDFAQPREHACPHCGRELEARGVALNGRVAWISHEPCGCESEKRPWKQRKRPRKPSNSVKSSTGAPIS